MRGACGATAGHHRLPPPLWGPSPLRLSVAAPPNSFHQVELANMNRLFFRPEQCGMTKTEAAAQTLSECAARGTPAADCVLQAAGALSCAGPRARLPQRDARPPTPSQPQTPSPLCPPSPHQKAASTQTSR